MILRTTLAPRAHFLLLLRTGIAACFAGTCFLGNGKPALAVDNAVVVGVSKYKNVAPYLAGPVNDANAIAESLKENGFTVKRLTNAEATKTAILAALSEAASKTTRADRFVFYFAGYGTDKPAAILPHDTRTGSHRATNPEVIASVLTKDELKAALKKVSAASRFVILDSSFSGGMRTQPDPDDTPTVYVAAATGQEQSYEKKMPDGKVHGLFTWELCKSLPKPGHPSISLGEFMIAVNAAVKWQSIDQQNPVATEGLEKTPVFGTRPDAEDTFRVLNKGEADSLWETYAADGPDSKAIRLESVPNKREYTVGETVTICVVLNREGYAIMLDRDPSGKMHLVYPEKFDAEYGHVFLRNDSDSRFELVLKFTDVGTERFKLILFSSKEEAQQLIDMFRANRSGITANVAKEIKLEGARTGIFNTSQVIYEVSATEGTEKRAVKPTSEAKP